MKRKLVKQGVNALTVTVPSSWIKKFGLEGGDEVEVTEQAKAVVLTTKKGVAVEKVTIDVTKLNDILVWTYIIAAYRKGCDEIEIIFEKPESMKLIQKVVDALLGLAIINQTKNACTIKDLSGETEAEFDVILRRIFLLLKNMAEDSLNGVKNNKELLENMEYQDYNVNKFSNFCLRLLSKRGYKDWKDTSIMHYIIAELENLGDEYTRLSLDAIDAKVSKESVEVFEEVNKLYNKYYDLFYKFSSEDAVKFVEQKNKLTEKIESLVKIKKGDDLKLLYHLSKIIHLIVNIGERQIMLSLD